MSKNLMDGRLDTLKKAIAGSAVGGIETPEPGTAARRYRFAPDFIGFAGHFPGYPILAAVLQILTAVTLAEEHAGRPLEMTGVENAKFLIQLRPEQEIEVRCRERFLWEKPYHEVRITHQDRVAASFLLSLRPAGSAP